MVSRCLEAAGPFAGRIDLSGFADDHPVGSGGGAGERKKTGKMLIVHEDKLDQWFGGRNCGHDRQPGFHYLDAPVERMAVPDVPIPYNIR